MIDKIWGHLREIIQEHDRPFELRTLLCKSHDNEIIPTNIELDMLRSKYPEANAAILLYQSEYFHPGEGDAM